MQTPAVRKYQFGVFEVNPASGELLKQGKRVKLQEQPFRLLVVLLENAGQIVSREEIEVRIWTDNTFVDFDNSLRVAVRKLREALGDDADNPQYVETIPKRGYRFLVPTNRPANSRQESTILDASSAVERDVSSERSSATSTWNQIASPRTGSSQKRWIVGVACLLVVILVAIAFLFFTRGGRGWRERLRPRPAQPLIQSLAVLPLKNLSQDPEQEYFAEGMTDQLTTDLAMIGPLRVVSRTSAMRYKGTSKTLPEIARELNVDGAVEGSVLRSGNRVRITVQLLHARADQHLWAQTYERDLGDVLKLQSEVAQAIARQVRMELTPQERARLSSARAVNPEAYEDYLKGRVTLRQLDATPQGINTARRYFEEAVQKDSEFALGYVGLADCYRDLGDFRRLSPQDAYPKATEIIRKALELDETLAEAHRTLGWLNWRYKWDWQAAEREFNYALELSPNTIVGYTRLFLYLGWSGRRAEALAAVAKIHELDPFYAAPLSELGIYYHQRDYKTMIEIGGKYVGSNPLEWLGHYHLAVGYEGSGRPLEAIAEYQKAIELSEGDQDPSAALAHVYATVGKRAEAEKILHELQLQSKNSYVSPYMIATIYAGLRNKEKAFEFLERAYQERSSDLPYFLKADLRIDTLRSDPRFQDLLRRVGLP